MASSSTREGARAKQQAFRLTPLFTALLLAYPALQARYALAEQTPANTPQTNTLPELGRPSDSPATLTPSPTGLTLDNRFDGKRLVVSPEYSDQTGVSLGGIFAFPMSDSAAGGLHLTAGARKSELLFNAGFQMDEAQRLILTLGQQRQHLDINFRSGAEKTAMTQHNGAVSYQFRMEQGSLNSAELNAYLAVTPSRDLADKSYAVDTAALYELWNDPRRVAGGRVTGLQGRLVFAPLPGATFKLGAGGERQEYDYLTGKQSTTRATGSAEWVQCLAGGYQAKAGADAAVQNRYTLGLERRLEEGGMLGASFTGIRGKNGAPNDNRINLTWSYTFDSKRATPDKCATPGNSNSAAQAWGSLLDQVAQRPGFLPAQVVAKLDTTTAPVRQILINKAALPAGASVNTATGVVTSPLLVAVTGIAGVTLNGAPFVNTGQFALSGNNLAIDPGKITQPAVGVTDTYVVTVNNLGGGTTLVTVVVSRGSVKIDSITISNGDTTAPTTSAAPSVSGTTATATTLSATLNENGTGYYLVQAAAAAAPNVAAVQAGSSFAMSANVAVTQTISGLTAFTAYKIYFVAKDAANNVQAAVQSVALTTSVPVALADSATTSYNIAKTGIDVLANDTGVAPTLTGMLSNPVGGTFTVNAGKIDFTPTNGFGGAASVNYEITDASNNKSTGVLTVTVGADPSIPVAVADSATTSYNTAITAIDVLANDINSGGVAPTLTGVLSNPVGGTFTVNAGKIDFTPTNGFSGAASVRYEIIDADGSNHKATGVLTVTVAAYVPPPAAAAPTASGLSIGGTVQAGQLLTGSYTYADANGDAQGVSTFRWLRGGVAIAGATASTYTLVIADVGSAITFEVTPVATVAPTTGTPVVSAATAAVTLPAGYVSQGGLTWMSVTFFDTWPNASAYCANTTILGQTGWRLPTTAELSALYASGAMNGQGWTVAGTWSSTPDAFGNHELVYLFNGSVDFGNDTNSFYVTCVR